MVEGAYERTPIRGMRQTLQPRTFRLGGPAAMKILFMALITAAAVAFMLLAAGPGASAA